MTPKQEAALRLALDCVSTLANARDWVGCTPNERWDEDEMYAELCNATICLKKSLSIIQEALAEQPAQQEPVAWKLVPTKPTEEMLKAMDECSKEGYDERLYAGHAASVYMAAVDAAPTPPAQRKPLTDEEIILIVADCASSHQHTDIHFARAIEAKLKEKNHG